MIVRTWDHTSCHACVQCLVYSSLKCSFDKFMTLPMLEASLTCLRHGVLYGGQAMCALSHAMSWGGVRVRMCVFWINQHMFCAH